MARVGQEMPNPVTRERFVWRHTAESTGGEFAEFDLFLGHGATVAAPHVHPSQREDFRVRSGAIALRIGGRKERLEAGAERTIPAGTAHAWSQTGDGDAQVTVRLTPALRSEEFFETFCGLARDGKVNARGMPSNPLQLALLAHEYRHEFALPSPAGRTVGLPILALLAWIARRRGLLSRYPEYANDI